MQSSIALQDVSGLPFRLMLNDALQTLITQNAGPTEPNPTYAFQPWADTTTGILKQRNATNNDWVEILDLATGRPVGAAAQTSPTGALLLAEGTDTQRPAPVDIPEGVAAVRGNTQNSLDYFLELWDRDDGVWKAIADRFWAGSVFAAKNYVINGAFQVNQRAYSGAATTAGQYVFDRWFVTGAGGVTFSTTANKTTVTIPAGQTIKQIVEGLFLQSGAYVLSWEGTAQARIGGGAYGSSGVRAEITGGVNTTIEFSAGTVANVRLEYGFANPVSSLPNPADELRRCQRYFRTSYIGSVAGSVMSAGALVGGMYGGAVGCIPVIFENPMRATPTVKIYSPASGVVGNVTDNIDRVASAPTLNSIRGFHITYAGNAAFLATMHYTAEAELA